MLEKIIEFFKKIFKKDYQRYIGLPKETTNSTERLEYINNEEEIKISNFKDEIIVDDKEEKRALRLQKDFKAGLIQEKDLSEEEFEILHKLYKSQIKKTKQSIQEYKNKIISIKSKLAQNN